MSTHRGCKEMDIILGNFAEKYLDQLQDDELILYERLLMESDSILYDAIVQIVFNRDYSNEYLEYSIDILMKIVLSHQSEYQHQLVLN